MNTDAVKMQLQAEDAALLVTLRETQQLGAEKGADILDLASAQESNAMALRMRERNLERQRAVRAAIRRVDQGTYGECVRCGEDIEPERLKFDATLACCASCAQRRG